MITRTILTLGQILLVCMIIIFVLYRVALLFDLVPDDFSPSGVVHKEYISFKQQLAADAEADEFTSHGSLIVLKLLEEAEKYQADKKQRDEAEERLEVSCQENSIYRFFMFMGDDKENVNKCNPSNMPLKPTVKETDARPQQYQKESSAGSMIVPPMPIPQPVTEPMTAPTQSVVPATGTQPISDPATGY